MIDAVTQKILDIFQKEYDDLLKDCDSETSHNADANLKYYINEIITKKCNSILVHKNLERVKSTPYYLYEIKVLKTKKIQLRVICCLSEDELDVILLVAFNEKNTKADYKRYKHLAEKRYKEIRNGGN